ncbi:phosphatase PAP2 family protein [Dactylosporangium sp. NBC_01737]|uniref:phosphatase PAP2 family protein n=1 Tax=Dactylosporangium sp. NBC_01737 TaxID=2975959 RepID=UPI002E0E9888|nr:phosphatase PAP2 family protein [Dactylosporangium sp. NBC_01737]
MNTGPGLRERDDAATRTTSQKRTRVRPRAWAELLLVVGLFLAYKMGRLLVDGRVGQAYENAKLVWHTERALWLPDEVDLQHLLLASDAVIRSANVYYAVVHFPATVAFLLFMYIFRPAHYLRFRRILAWLTAAGLVMHFAFPLAPPRMLAGIGMVDTAAKFGPSVYGPPQTDTLSNQYAAMPSLHVGWALVVACGLIVATRSRWRWLWLAHPVITTVVVVGTANHYWLDGIIAAILVGALMLAVGRARRPADAPPAKIPVQLRRNLEYLAVGEAAYLATLGDTITDSSGQPQKVGKPT